MNSRKNDTIHRKTQAPLFPLWVEDRGLSFLLGFLLLIVIFVPMLPLSRYGGIGLGLIFALMVLSGAIATIRQRILMYLVITLTVLDFAVDLIVEFNPTLGHWDWDTTLKISGLAILMIMTLRQTFRSGPVNLHRVMGGVAAYLLTGVTWALGYKLLMDIRPGAIYFQRFAGGVPTGEPSGLMSFSFSTLTSANYVDAFPVHRIARSLATAEALIGQLYPAVLIARLVGMSLQTRANVGAEP